MAANTLDNNKMRTMPVGKLLFNMALPLALSMLVQALYNVVDSIYVSRISESAVTALSLAFPIQNLIIGFATGIGVGMNSILSKSLGENNRQRVNVAAGNGIFLMLIAVAIFMVFGFVGARPFFAIQSSVEETVRGGGDYLTICCIFSLGIFVEVLGERMLQASGRTIYTLFTQGTGAVVNIILDPVFIFGVPALGIPAFGMAGAAIATVIGQWIAAILAIIFNLTRNPEVQFALKYIHPDPKVLSKILSVGIPSIIMMAIGSIMTFSMNGIFQSFKDYGETATGVFGVYFKLQSFVFMPIFGINNASVSIIAYNYGARLPARITKNLKFAMAAALTIMLLGLAVFQLFPTVLLGLFEPTDDFLRLGISALRLVSLSFPLAGVSIALSATFQAMGVGIYSTVTSLCRQLFVLVPVAYLLSLSGNVELVWWAFPMAELVSLTVTLIFFRRIHRNKIKPLYERQEAVV
ncbi:MAG: MATE family efflux transporter [Ruminococcaceae bacterium]|nr:MATE family efflux transporter [Oscillospiraceae bacterium]